MNPTPREILDVAARTRIPDNLNLYPRLAAQLERKTFMQSLRARPALLVITVLLALTLLTGVAYAVGRLSGFIPGFGFTGDTSTVLVLEEPSQTEHEGITMTVDKAVSTQDKFWVSLTLNGNLDASGLLYITTKVITPDGTEVQFMSGMENEVDTGKLTGNYEFAPLPVGTTALTFYYELSTQDGLVFWSASVPLRLRPIRADEVIPVPETNSAAIQSEMQNGLILMLDNVATASDKTVLQVSLKFEQPNTTLNTQWNVTLTGDGGKIYPLTEVLDDYDTQSKTYETLPFSGGENLTLTLVAFPEAEALPASVDFPVGVAQFTFDPGTSPQVGQTWEMSQWVQAGKYFLHVIGAKLVSPTELTFEFESIPDVTGVMLYSEPAKSGTGSIPAENKNFTATLGFEKIPDKAFEVSITRVGYVIRGKWQIQWQAPAAPEGVIVGPTATPAPTGEVFITPTVASDDPLQAEVLALAQKFDAPFIQGSGWVHWVKSTESYQRAGQSYPPPYITTEYWLELDENGNVIRSLTMDKDKDGNLLQQSVSIGNYFVNFTTGETGYNEYSSYPFSTDMLTHDLTLAAQYQTQITREEVTCEDGSPCLLITLYDAFEQGSQTPGDTQLTFGMGRKTWVNLDTGQQVKMIAFSRFEDGSERAEFTEITLSVEKVSVPPEDVLRIIEGVMVP